MNLHQLPTRAGRGLMVLPALLAAHSGWAHPQQTITLSLQNVPLATGLAKIERASSFRFLYNPGHRALNSKISLQVKDASLPQVMDLLLANTGLGYQLMPTNLVVIKPLAELNLSENRAAAPIRGRITDDAGRPIAGATVQVKGSTRGTVSDESGNFTIDAEASETLIFSALNFGTVERVVGAQTSVQIVLPTATASLDQVVVVGYGTQRKRDLTGATASVKGAELARQPVLTATQALQGKVAGVQIITSGAPNALPIVRVRGTGTVLAGANPLYVVDGVITDDIRNINSNDILTLDVLKDASSTAIYGMRAANGVILITTKKGRTGKLVVNYDANVGLREATNLVDMAGPRQYANYVNEANIFYGNGDSLILNSMLATGGNTDWYDAILRRAFQQNHNISFSGGSEQINYFFSAGYITDEGIIRTNNFNRFTLRSNVDYKLTSKLKLSTLFSYSRAEARNVDLNVFNVAYRAAPYVLAEQNGKYGNTSLSNNVGNPLLDLDKQDNRIKGDRLQGTGVAEYKPLSWLTLRSSFGVDMNFDKSVNYGFAYLNAGPESVFLTNGGNQLRPRSSLAVNNNNSNRWVWDNTATIDKRFGKHSLNVLLGTTAERFNFSGIGGTRLDVPANRDQWYLSAGASTPQNNNSEQDRFTRASYIARLNYGFDNRYNLTATLRADGTSRFASNNRWGYFPSVGAGWTISEEKFLKNTSVLSLLRLRASWGRVGNDQIPTSTYFPLAAINIPYFFNGQEYLAIAFRELPDRNVRWEVTEEINLGLDFGFFKNKLSGEVNVYDKQTSNALINVPIAAILGDANSLFTTNAASFTNRGLELALNWADNAGRDFTYNIGGNIAFNRNEVTNLNGGQALFAGGVGGGQNLIAKTDNGQPIGSFFVLQTNGVFQNAAEIAGSAQPNARPGDLRYVDVSGPQGKPDGVINELDRTFQGSYLPKITYGINGGATYKGFDLNVGATGVAGNMIYNGKRAIRGIDGRDNVETEIAQNRWTPNNPGNKHPRAQTGQLPASSYFLEKGDFFRLNNLTIGYRLPASLLNRWKLSNLRFYLTSQNLFTLTPYSGFTPEIANGSTIDGGIELAIYPTTRTYAFGLNLAF